MYFTRETGFFAHASHSWDKFLMQQSTFNWMSSIYIFQQGEEDDSKSDMFDVD